MGTGLGTLCAGDCVWVKDELDRCCADCQAGLGNGARGARGGVWDVPRGFLGADTDADAGGLFSRYGGYVGQPKAIAMPLLGGSLCTALLKRRRTGGATRWLSTAQAGCLCNIGMPFTCCYARSRFTMSKTLPYGVKARVVERCGGVGAVCTTKSPRLQELGLSVFSL